MAISRILRCSVYVVALSPLYQLNAYRVLLTRARQGLVICVPTGNTADDTRLPVFYNGTYEYLKSLGLEELHSL